MLEERDDGTLARMLATQLTLNELLLGRAQFLFVLGFVQISVMFCWAAVAFGLDLFGTPATISRTGRAECSLRFGIWADDRHAVPDPRAIDGSGHDCGFAAGGYRRKPFSALSDAFVARKCRVVCL